MFIVGYVRKICKRGESIEVNTRFKSVHGIKYGREREDCGGVSGRGGRIKRLLSPSGRFLPAEILSPSVMTAVVSSLLEVMGIVIMKTTNNTMISFDIFN